MQWLDARLLGGNSCTQCAAAVYSREQQHLAECLWMVGMISMPSCDEITDREAYCHATNTNNICHIVCLYTHVC